MTWQWLRQDVVVAVHDKQIAEHGGHPVFPGITKISNLTYKISLLFYKYV